MNILFSTKDIEQRLFTRNILPDEGGLKEWLYEFHYESLSLIPGKETVFSFRLLDDSYGQFMYSTISETLILSHGIRRTRSNIHSYGNYMSMFSYRPVDEHRDPEKFWHKIFQFPVDGCLLKSGDTYTEENIKMVMTDTKKYMKQLLPCLDSFRKVYNKMQDIEMYGPFF